MEVEKPVSFVPDKKELIISKMRLMSSLWIMNESV